MAITFLTNVDKSVLDGQINELSEEITKINNNVLTASPTSKIAPNDTTFFLIAKNLFNLDTITEQHFINQLTGEPQTSIYYHASDFIQVSPATTYELNAGIESRYVFYDTNKNYISGEHILTDEPIKIISPVNAEYFRFSYQHWKNPNTISFSVAGIAVGDAPYINPEYIRLDTHSFPLNLPTKLYALVGEELNIWFDNLVDGHDTDYVFEVNCSVGMQLERCYRLVADEAGEYNLTIKAIDKHGATVTKTAKIIVAAADAGNGDTVSLIVLGDSTTNNGIAIDKLNTNFMSDTEPMNIITLGTRGEGRNMHEGRSGWTFSKFFESAGDSDSSVTNPFYNPTTKTFDAIYYFANSGVPIPEWFFINLGINDTFGYYDDETLTTSIESLNTYCDQMITSLKTAASTIKIGVCLTIPPNYSQDAFGKAYNCGQTRNRYKRNNVLWVENLIKKYDERESENIYLVPIHTNLDTKYGMGMEEMPHSKRNTETYLSPYGNGGVHPVESGYWQIADVYQFFLKSFKKKTANSLLDFTTRMRTDAVNTVNSTDPHEMDENKCYPCGITGVRSHSSNVKISEYNVVSKTDIQLKISSDQTGVGMEFPVPTLEAGKTYTLTYNCDLPNMRIYLLKYKADTTAYDSNELLSFEAGTHTHTIVPDAAYVYSLLFNVQVGDQLSTFSDVTLVKN